MSHMVACAVMVVMWNVGALCNNTCINGEPWGVVVFIPLHDAFYEGYNENADYKEKYKAEHNLKQVKIKAEAEHKSSHSFYSILKHGNYIVKALKSRNNFSSMGRKTENIVL